MQSPPHPTPDVTDEPAVIPSAAGMTTKVVKGSLWTLAGQVIPLGVSLFTTPIVIRLLGAEGYGALILVTLIPGYLGFIDFGMGMASTKFGSEAFAAGSREKEARIVRTAALIAVTTSTPFIILMVFLSGTVIEWFNVPEHLRADASLALKIASLTTELNILNMIFNTPQLTRLRMDLNTLVNGSFRVLGSIATPIVVYCGGGIVGALIVLMCVSALTLLGHLVVSGRLLREMFKFSIERSAVRPMLRFGIALVGATIAAMLLTNLEKAVLPKLISVTELAYYSVGFTFAAMLTLFAGSMSQSLVPAFSQLRGGNKVDVLASLYTRAIRLNLIWLIPVITFLALIAKTFFTIWAGPDFGVASVLPFYVLLIGLIFNIPAHVPFSVIMAAGRTDVFAKIYWGELIPYGVLVWFLVQKFGAVGAAMAWSVRVFFDAILLFVLADRIDGVSIRGINLTGFAFGALIMSGPFILFLFYQELNVIVLGFLLVSLVLYALVVWKLILRDEEAIWLKNKLRAWSTSFHES